MEVHRQYNIRSKKSQDIATKKNAENPVKRVFDSDPKKTTENPPRKTTKTLGKKSEEPIIKKAIDTSTRNTQIDLPSTSQQTELAKKLIADKSDSSKLLKNQTLFSIENELSKLKISIPLTELVNKNVYMT